MASVRRRCCSAPGRANRRGAYTVGSAVVGRPPRPSLLTPSVRDTITTALAAGAYIDDAAQYANVSRSSVYGWLDRGRKELARLEADEEAEPNPDEALCLDFLDAVTRAQARCKVANLVIIGSAGQGQKVEVRH